MLGRRAGAASSWRSRGPIGTERPGLRAEGDRIAARGKRRKARPSPPEAGHTTVLAPKALRLLRRCSFVGCVPRASGIAILVKGLGGGGRGVCDHSQSACVLRLSLPAPDCGLAGRLFGEGHAEQLSIRASGACRYSGKLGLLCPGLADAWLRDVPGARLPCITVVSAFMYAREGARTVHRSPCADAWPHTRRAGRTCDHTSPLIGAGKCLDKLGWQGGTAPQSKSGS